MRAHIGNNVNHQDHRLTSLMWLELKKKLINGGAEAVTEFLKCSVFEIPDINDRTKWEFYLEETRFNLSDHTLQNFYRKYCHK